jgi:4-amino-4-deoxy-L-arabinose transferase-like glycosyltransferase
MKFKKRNVELFLFLLMIILTVIILYLAIDFLEIFPKENPPSEPFEYPK